MYCCASRASGFLFLFLAVLAGSVGLYNVGKKIICRKCHRALWQHDFDLRISSSKPSVNKRQQWFWKYPALEPFDAATLYGRAVTKIWWQRRRGLIHETGVEGSDSDVQRDDARSNTYDKFSLMACQWSIGCSSEVAAVWEVEKRESIHTASTPRLTHVSARRGEVPSTGAVNQQIISVIFYRIVDTFQIRATYYRLPTNWSNWRLCVIIYYTRPAAPCEDWNQLHISNLVWLSGSRE